MRGLDLLTRLLSYAMSGLSKRFSFLLIAWTTHASRVPAVTSGAGESLRHGGIAMHPSQCPCSGIVRHARIDARAIRSGAPSHRDTAFGAGASGTWRQAPISMAEGNRAGRKKQAGRGRGDVGEGRSKWEITDGHRGPNRGWRGRRLEAEDTKATNDSIRTVRLGGLVWTALRNGMRRLQPRRFSSGHGLACRAKPRGCLKRFVSHASEMTRPCRPSQVGNSSSSKHALRSIRAPFRASRYYPFDHAPALPERRDAAAAYYATAEAIKGGACCDGLSDEGDESPEPWRSADGTLPRGASQPATDRLIPCDLVIPESPM
ncbi:hypothetical protein PCL_05747 [Purpureocillium lilacinum]|uniref:Uncharacterized protein n=1 Tax=Purpureocillium lilacinum TaxID=33203 RepID=A0A2U3EKQ1_PURLI|nr:hypothetical protein Purlil1_11068 [Purpureocillium lilacinum]PWI75089.1 hypothetical protein PCL_05747 [Purpureocillium lilacinum]